MMKIHLLIFSLHLISGPVAHSDVIGYSGGGVIILSDLKWVYSNPEYICKKGQTTCVDIIRSDTESSSVQKDRFMLYRNSYGYMRVLIKKLQPQDAGKYTIRLDLVPYFDVDLEVRNDSCCGKSKQVKAYAGENITLTCNYPKYFEEKYKYFAKLGDNNVIEDIVNTENMYQRGRFSISDDRRKKCFNVSISDVREEDEGDYLCAVFVSTRQYTYYFFTEIELQVTGTSSVTSTAPTETASDAAHFTSSVIIGVCVCVGLLLIGGLVVMVYKLGCKKKQGSMPPSRSLSGNKNVPMAKEEYIYNSDTGVYQSSPAREADPTEQPDKQHNLTYTTVRFLKNPDDNAVSTSKEESVTEYATVLHQTRK